MSMTDIFHGYDLSGEELPATISLAVSKRIEVLKLTGEKTQNDQYCVFKNAGMLDYVLNYRSNENDKMFELLGYYMLIFIYANNENLYLKLIEQESDLLSFRLSYFGIGEDTAEIFQKISYEDLEPIRLDVSEYNLKNKVWYSSNFKNAHCAVAVGDAIMIDGKVYMDEDTLYKLLINQHKKKMSKRITNIKTKTISPEFKKEFLSSKYIDIRNMITTRNEDFGNFDQNIAPPCIKNMYLKLSTEKLSHDERVILMFFQRSAGMTLEDAMEFWSINMSRVVSDKPIEYYLDSVKRVYNNVKYDSYSCAKINRLGLCPFKGNMKLCCGGKNLFTPTMYYRSVKQEQCENNDLVEDDICDIEDLL